jgi:hypothetical protein
VSGEWWESDVSPERISAGAVGGNPRTSDPTGAAVANATFDPAVMLFTTRPGLCGLAELRPTLRRMRTTHYGRSTMCFSVVDRPLSGLVRFREEPSRVRSTELKVEQVFQPFRSRGSAGPLGPREVFGAAQGHSPQALGRTGSTPD